MAKEREQLRDVETLAGEFGCRYEIEATRRGHVRVVFVCDRQRGSLTMAKGHGDDVRGRKNNLARMRRILREISNGHEAYSGR